MSLLIPVLFGLGVGFGLFLIIGGWFAAFTKPRKPDTKPEPVDRPQLRLGLSVAAALCIYLFTGWPVGALLGAVGGWSAPTLVGAKSRRAARIAKTEAVASWAEQLRDVVSVAGGVNEALASTARVAPLPIRGHIQEMVRRTRRGNIDDALANLAAELDDATADQVIVALRLAVGERAEKLSEVLSAVAEAARDQATLGREIEASRAKLWRQATTVAGVIIGVFVLIVVMQGSYLEAYNTAAGQVMLLVVAGLWFGAIRMMIRLANIASPARTLNATKLASP